MVLTPRGVDATSVESEFVCVLMLFADALAMLFYLMSDHKRFYRNKLNSI